MICGNCRMTPVQSALKVISVEKFEFERFEINLILMGFYDLTFQYTETIIPKEMQKQPSRGVLTKRCSENMQQTYRRAAMLKCDFNKVAKQLY